MVRMARWHDDNGDNDGDDGDEGKSNVPSVSSRNHYDFLRVVCDSAFGKPTHMPADPSGVLRSVPIHCWIWKEIRWYSQFPLSVKKNINSIIIYNEERAISTYHIM